MSAAVNSYRRVDMNVFDLITTNHATSHAVLTHAQTAYRAEIVFMFVQLQYLGQRLRICDLRS